MFRFLLGYGNFISVWCREPASDSPDVGRRVKFVPIPAILGTFPMGSL